MGVEGGGRGVHTTLAYALEVVVGSFGRQDYALSQPQPSRC